MGHEKRGTLDIMRKLTQAESRERWRRVTGDMWEIEDAIIECAEKIERFASQKEADRVHGIVARIDKVRAEFERTHLL